MRLRLKVHLMTTNQRNVRKVQSRRQRTINLLNYYYEQITIMNEQRFHTIFLLNYFLLKIKRDFAQNN